VASVGGGALAVLRPPIGLERMLRMYIAQQCFSLSDEGIEDAIYDSQPSIEERSIFSIPSLGIMRNS